MTLRIILLATLALLTGCNTMPVVKGDTVQTVPCLETMPERPTMATEVLPPDSKVDPWVQAAQSEIQDREGYEIELRAALRNCIRPINRAGK